MSPYEWAEHVALCIHRDHDGARPSSTRSDRRRARPNGIIKRCLLPSSRSRSIRPCACSNFGRRRGWTPGRSRASMARSKKSLRYMPPPRRRRRSRNHDQRDPVPDAGRPVGNARTGRPLWSRPYACWKSFEPSSASTGAASGQRRWHSIRHFLPHNYIVARNFPRDRCCTSLRTIASRFAGFGKTARIARGTKSQKYYFFAK